MGGFCRDNSLLGWRLTDPRIDEFPCLGRCIRSSAGQSAKQQASDGKSQASCRSETKMNHRTVAPPPNSDLSAQRAKTSSTTQIQRWICSAYIKYISTLCTRRFKNHASYRSDFGVTSRKPQPPVHETHLEDESTHLRRHDVQKHRPNSCNTTPGPPLDD